MIIEPILREPGSVSFAWMEIQRTRASLVNLFENQTNFSGNETLLEVIFLFFHSTFQVSIFPYLVWALSERKGVRIQMSRD